MIRWSGGRPAETPGGVSLTMKLLLLLVLSVTCVRSATVHLYVSPTGNDANDGRNPAHPVKTLQHVQTMLGQSGVHGNTVFVELMSGYHDLASTLHLQSTSGTVVFRAYQGQEVHVTGGRRLDVAQFHRVSDPAVLHQLRLPASAAQDGHVLQLDLTAAGLTDLGKLRTYGQHIKAPIAPLEIFINGKPLKLAEWPNAPGYLNILSIPDGSAGRRLGFDALGRDLLWANETEPWGYGFWRDSYADFSLAFSHVDPVTHIITLKERNRKGLGIGHFDQSDGYKSAGNMQGGYFRVINMLSELDTPGEYYIDRRNKMLYLWPNTPQQTLTSADIVYASMVDECISVESSAQHVHFEDFTLEYCRHHGVQLVDSRNVTIKNMEIRNTGGNAVNCTNDCRGVSVLASDIYDVNGGIFLGGGERTTLTSSENVIRDNHIYDHARSGAFPNNGIYIEGVSAVVSHNHLHHGQYTGIWWMGNDHLMEYNHVHHMCINASDCGALHTFRDWTLRGNVIRHNHIHDTKRFVPGSSNRGIMLDDQYSSVLIESNVMYDNDIHINVGGGRDNVIRLNVFNNAREESLIFDSRGQHHGMDAFLTNKLNLSPYRTELWKTRYPLLYNILDKEAWAPEGNQIYNNVIRNEGHVPNWRYASPHRTDWWNVHDNHQVHKLQDFYSTAASDFRLRCDSAQWASSHHFPTPVTLDQVGPEVITGPHYLRVHRHAAVATTAVTPPACDASTAAPAAPPALSYLPDGTGPNTMFPHIPKHGCWLVTQHCASHPELDGTAEDTAGSQSGTEEGCLARAAKQFQHCGSGNSTNVYAVWGPTGATTFSALGCFTFYYGCRGAAHARLNHDVFSEDAENGTTNKDNCLSRAARIWHYCGSGKDKTTTAVFGATGELITAGAGCWLKIPSCPADASLEGYFFDAWGDTNRGTGVVQEECFSRATDYWAICGSHDNTTVTAFYRPLGISHTVNSGV